MILLVGNDRHCRNESKNGEAFTENPTRPAGSVIYHNCFRTKLVADCNRLCPLCENDVATVSCNDKMTVIVFNMVQVIKKWAARFSVLLILFARTKMNKRILIYAILFYLAMLI